MKNREVEFKYPAEEVELQTFHEFCEKRKPIDFKIISGLDHFYRNSKENSSFYRHRVNTNENQLTFKRKTQADNSFIREEHNIDLPLSVTEEKIADLCGITGYNYSTSIFKNCFIYNYEYYTLVYYICYDTGMKELGRYVEIEMREDYAWESEDEAWSSLVAQERTCKAIGANPQSRVYLSLFELFGGG